MGDQRFTAGQIRLGIGGCGFGNHRMASGITRIAFRDETWASELLRQSVDKDYVSKNVDVICLRRPTRKYS